MLADLHSHTYFSDGALAPADLIARALANQVDYLAITDHDTTAALRAVDLDSLPEHFHLVPGVEVSCLWEGIEVHVVGIGIDIDNAPLQALLSGQQALRRERAQAIDMRLQKAGHTGLMRYLDALPCAAISRNHVAQFLMERGIAKSKDDAFKRFLGQRGKFSAQAQWCAIPVAVQALRDAGGIAILAHPNRYGLSNIKLRRLVSEFALWQGEGIEVSFSNIAPDKMSYMASLCEANDLWASTGSDFHDPKYQWMDVGRFRHLPALCAQRAIWLHPGWPGHSVSIGA